MHEHVPKDAEIRIWPADKAPEALRGLIDDAATEWVVLIPASMVSNEIEVLFWRWHSEEHSVTRRTLPNGAVVLMGSYPSATTMTSTPIFEKNSTLRKRT
jgi:hypothetical protein